MSRLILYQLILVLLSTSISACSNKDARKIPVQILSASAAPPQLTEVTPIKQILRPQDVLDVIFHIGSSLDTPYLLRPGDKVDISFLSAPELSGSKLVLPDGTIELPYVGNLKIAGLTADQANQALESRYANVLKHPQITLSIYQALDNLRTSLTHPGTGLSREITVGADGGASFPLLGGMSLSGKSLDELQHIVNRRYASEVGQISVDILLKKTAANEVFVMGEVGRPGAYPIRRPISVLEALALAKGPNTNARLDSVVIMRRHNNQVETRVYDVDSTLDGNALNFAYLQADDLLYVPKGRLAKAVDLSTQIAELIKFQGYGVSFGYRLDKKSTDDN